MHTLLSLVGLDTVMETVLSLMYMRKGPLPLCLYTLHVTKDCPEVFTQWLRQVTPNKGMQGCLETLTAAETGLRD